MAKKKRHIKKQIYIIPTAIIVILVTIYLFLCILAGSNDFMSDMNINGINVSGMTKDQAVEAIENQYKKDSQNISLTYKVNEKDYIVNLKDNVSFDAKKEINDIYDKIHSSFLTKGYYYLFEKDYTTSLEIKDEKKLLEELKKSKLLDVDSKKNTTYQLGDSEVIFTKGTSGEKVSQEDILNQTHQALENYDLHTPIECQLVKSELSDNEMIDLHKKLNQKGQNATLKLDKDYNYEIVDSKDGVSFTLEDAQSAYNKASEGEEFRVSAKINKAKIDKETLKKNLFKDVLGEYTTYVSGSSVRRNNVRLAGIKCNKIMLPGETFSYNDTVGQRTTANGFGKAAAYVNGETVDEVGGGVCQASSTLYNAVLYANLQVVERTNHTYISSYVPLGRDATVSWGGPDFKFKNNTDYPIKIVVSYNGRLNVKIYGTDLEDTKVEITCQRLSTIAPKIKYEKDDTLEEGTEKVEEKGSNGAKCQTYRKVYKNGKLVSTSKESYSYYKPHQRVVLQGTKKKEEKKDKKNDKKNDNKKPTNNNQKPTDNQKPE